MLARRSQHVTSESWHGHWGADARYYARRSDGVCFAIDSAVNVLDLAGTTPPLPHARPVDSLPLAGRYTLSVFALNSLDASRTKSSGDMPSASDLRGMTPRLLAYGVRRRG